MAYFGGKSGDGVYQTLINLMPPHDVYIEPFLGGGAILRIKRPARESIGVDRDPDVVERWKSLAFSSDARSAHVICGDGIQFLRAYPFTGRDLVYCDPPYLLSTRRSRTRYAFELSDAQHQELLSVIKRLPCMVMISGYWSALYATALSRWHVYTFQAATRGRPAQEWVWCNYPRPVELHDYRFLGDNFREREKLKRQQRRWKGKLDRMTPLQRQALLSVLAELST
jgi:DNA adenine methylase